MKICEKCKEEVKYYYCLKLCCMDCEDDYCCPHSCYLKRLLIVNQRGDNMDYEVGTCKECGGILIYIHSLNQIICDTCDYEKEDAN